MTACVPGVFAVAGLVVDLAACDPSSVSTLISLTEQVLSGLKISQTSTEASGA